MMSDDIELKRMFEAQRKIDEAMVPSFDDIHARSLASGGASPMPFAGMSLRSVAAVVALALLALCGFQMWPSLPQQDKANVASAAQDDLQRVNHACDSLLATIGETHPATVAHAAHQSDQEMEWPTGTDSLLPFDVLAFNSRTSP